jgi:hypothetical protein
VSATIRPSSKVIRRRLDDGEPDTSARQRRRVVIVDLELDQRPARRQSICERLGSSYI